jgi:predicted pyridoxine 5'-phosphate oxidase superfamily flavin-nucleotide-binding protein
MSTLIDIAFTPSVKAIQSRKGSREIYEKLSPGPGFFEEIDDNLRLFLATQNTAFLATATADGQPYIQHRGGPAGFIKVLDKHTLAFADFKGNRQFISQGNLAENPLAYLFLIEYKNRKRIKIWGHAQVVEDDPALLQSLMLERESYRALPEQVIKFTVRTWDRNCPQHIPVKIDEEQFSAALKEKDDEIARLKQEISSLKNQAV